MVAEWDETGGLDLAKANAWLAARQPQLLMLGQVKAAKLYGGLEVETTLDPKQQPFLYDHAMDGTPLLPGVMGTEAFGQLALALGPRLPRGRRLSTSSSTRRSSSIAWRARRCT
jgi:3-hydroxymyristoyl/3-hydroxydecanoyl-(acyl carrier protein) dehydratase